MLQHSLHAFQSTSLLPEHVEIVLVVLSLIVTDLNLQCPVVLDWYAERQQKYMQIVCRRLHVQFHTYDWITQKPPSIRPAWTCWSPRSTHGNRRRLGCRPITRVRMPSRSRWNRSISCCMYIRCLTSIIFIHPSCCSKPIWHSSQIHSLLLLK